MTLLKILDNELLKQRQVQLFINNSSAGQIYVLEKILEKKKTEDPIIKYNIQPKNK